MAKSILAQAALALGTVIPDVSADPRKLKPGQLCRILNSTPLGPVIDDRRLRAHRQRAGLRIGEATSIDLFRYAAWLAEQWAGASTPATNSPIHPKGESDAYQRKKDTERDRQATKSRSGRDIGPPPAVVDPDRRAKAEQSFRAFCESYFPERFSLGWSRDHLKVIDRIERAVLKGGRFALAMPRGSGKTSLCEVAAIWALAIGARKFVMLIGASADAARQLLEAIKTEIEANELFSADFPEISHPIQRLEGRANMAAGQHINGDRTHITYGKAELVLPTVAGSKASGAVLRVRGLTGGMRGAKFVQADGTNIRPDLVVVDDPQTDASAKSVSQCTTRERILAGAVLGLAGPGKKIAAIMPCTVIERGDMADRILDRQKHPEWQGERCKMVYAFPSNDKLWEEYWEIRRQSLINGGDGSEATAFYKKNRKAMDAGADVAWEDRYEPGELSAIQNAMNLRFSNEAAFYSEYQNEPLTDSAGDEDLLTREAIAAKLNGLARGVVPLWATHLTSFVDVQHRLLYWVVCAWSSEFSGAVVDYGTWPDQGRSYFAYRTVKKTLQQQYKGQSLKAILRAALADLSEHLIVKRSWKNEQGVGMSLGRMLVDAADGNATDAVFEFCRTSPYSSLLLPATGKGIGPADAPMHVYRPKPGEKLGFHCVLQPVPKYAYRQVLIDVNFWKSSVHDRLGIPLGDRGCLSLFGDKRTDHRMFAEHLRSETRERLRNEKNGRVVDVWKLPPSKPDNHFLDCLSGSAVAASLLGSSDVARRKPKAAAGEAKQPTVIYT